MGKKPVAKTRGPRGSTTWRPRERFTWRTCLGGVVMWHIWFSALLGVLMGVGFASGEPKETKPQDKPTDPVEKIAPGVDRQLTGIVEMVESKDENNGKLTVRTSGPEKGSPYLYVFQVDEGKTKILNADGDLLADGLKSRMLSKAEVRVEFVDQQTESKEPPPGLHFARKVQIITPGK